MTTRKLAEVFPPGDFIKEELEARGWSQTDLAKILGRPVKLVNDIVLAKREITPETAHGLAGAFGTSGELWLNLESAYKLWKLGPQNDKVQRRARLYALGPVKEMARRGWVADSKSVNELEKEFCQFFEIDSINQNPVFWGHAARKSTAYSDLFPGQLAWLFRARQLARTMEAPKFTDRLLVKCLNLLQGMLACESSIRNVPNALHECGIRLVIVEPLRGTRIDGATFWLDAQSPVVALSLRYDRIDHFWFTLLHEIAHVKKRDGLRNSHKTIDADLVGNTAVDPKAKPAFERYADELAAKFLVPQKNLEAFIASVKPRYSDARIVDFARRSGTHPALVVGQLQFRGEISYAHSRRVLVRVRNRILETGVTDGWGMTA